MKLTRLDAEILDLIADDTYGLWEVEGYVRGLESKIAIENPSRQCRESVRKLVDEGYAQLFLGYFEGYNFECTAQTKTQEVLENASSWEIPPDLDRKVFAIAGTEVGEAVLLEEWPTF